MIEFSDYYLKMATIKDIDSIMEFIRINWNANHILAVSKEFFEYEHLIEPPRVNFLIATKKSTFQIDACQGFLQYSPNIAESDLFCVVWKCKENLPVFMLGTETHKLLRKYFEHNDIWCVGINEKTALPIFKKVLGYKTGKLLQYYRLKHKSSYSLAIIKERPMKPTPVPHNSFSLKEIYLKTNPLPNLEKLLGFQKHPSKSIWYFLKRYVDNVFYQYRFWGIVSDGSCCGLIVSREDEAINTKVLRIVDYVGKEEYLAYISDEFERLLNEYNYEYIDFYQHGIAHEIMEKAGFVLRSDYDCNVIPNYFNPFEQKNIDILYSTTYSGEDYRLFKADGDQDRLVQLTHL